MFLDQDDGREKSPTRKRPKKDNKENKDKQGTPKKDKEADKQSTKTRKVKVILFSLQCSKILKKKKKKKPRSLDFFYEDVAGITN